MAAFPDSPAVWGDGVVFWAVSTGVVSGDKAGVWADMVWSPGSRVGDWGAEIEFWPGVEDWNVRSGVTEDSGSVPLTTGGPNGGVMIDAGSRGKVVEVRGCCCTVSVVTILAFGSVESFSFFLKQKQLMASI